MSIDKYSEILKTVFDLESIKTEQKREGNLFGSAVVTVYHIPEHTFTRIANDFPLLKHAYKAGLATRDKSHGVFKISSGALDVRSTDKRKLGSRQFFSVDGSDNTERTTMFDAIKTIENVKNFASKLLLDPKKLKYTINHRDGNPDDVVNFIELDRNLFGFTEEDIEKNVEKINRAVKFVRGGEYGIV